MRKPLLEAQSMPYSGRFGRNGLPMPFVMMLPLIALLILWRSGKKPETHHIGGGMRRIVRAHGAHSTAQRMTLFGTGRGSIIPVW